MAPIFCGTADQTLCAVVLCPPQQTLTLSPRDIPCLLREEDKSLCPRAMTTSADRTQLHSPAPVQPHLALPRSEMRGRTVITLPLASPAAQKTGRYIRRSPPAPAKQLIVGRQLSRHKFFLEEKVTSEISTGLRLSSPKPHNPYRGTLSVLTPTTPSLLTGIHTVSEL